MKNKTILLTFSIKKSTVTDFFMLLANKLVDRGYRVVIITDGKREDLVSIDTNPIILTWPSKRPTTLKDALFLYKIIRKYSPKTSISIFGSVNITLITGFLGGISTRIAWYRTLSTQFKLNPFFKFRKRFIYKLASYIVANSNASKKDLINTYGINPKKIKVVYNAVKIENKTPLQKERLPETIVYAGRLHPTKGVDILLKALAIVKKKFPYTKLIILGDGPSKQELLELTRKLNLTENVIFKGIVPPEEVLDWFSKAQFSVVPSLHEAFGLVVIEAMKTATPVIASNTDGPAEIIRDGIDGFLFPIKNHQKLAEKMIYLLKNPLKAREMGINAFERVKNNFNLEKITDDLIYFIEEQLNDQ